MGVSVSAFAAIRKKSRKTGQEWKAKGLLVFEADGSVNVEASHARLDARPARYRGGNTEPEGNTVGVAPSPSERLEVTAERMITAGVVTMLPHAEAVAKKENFLALLRELEYDRESGSVVAIEEAVREIVEQLARVRTKLLSIPTKVAGRLALLRSAEEVEAFLTEEIALALEELSGDTDGPACVRKI